MKPRHYIITFVVFILWTVAVFYFAVSSASQVVQKQETKSVAWFGKLAERGDAPTQYLFGMAYLYGLTIGIDNHEALKWLKKSSEQGYAPAEYDLGYMYSEGLGIPPNYAEAAIWFQKAATQGIPAARINLGILYHEGKGVPKDYAKAFILFKTQAELGTPLAQAQLGDAYYNGWGVQKDDVLAYKWIYLAATADDAYASDKAGHYLASIEKTMTPDQIAEAKKLAAKWKKP